MAIEFDCPYCTATIRVPDAYGGQQGRCPKCDTRLLVPMVVRPGNTTVPDASALPATASNPAAPNEPQLPEAVFAIRPPSPTAAIRRRRTRRRPSRALVIGMPVLCFLVLLAGIFFSITNSLPELNGELTAKRVDEQTLPAVLISWVDTGLSPDDQQTLKDFLKNTPETLTSEVMTCRLVGTDDGIEVLLTSSVKNEWYAVDTTSSKPLALWLKRERAALNGKRLNLLHTGLAAYCRDKLAQIGGEPLAIDAITVRDNVGINACCDALGFAVQAVTDNQIVPCSYEDSKGALYFCLPKGIQSFQIKGRTMPDQSMLFGGDYKVVIAGGSAPQPAKAEELPEVPVNEDPPPTDGEMMPKSDSKSTEMEGAEMSVEPGQVDG